ncbi:MAG: hypothetical protein H6620_11835 [Halobacteriovoraceae bacterium]|nr:hypothetical protein [Halobacteriovoraceae bacterium]
MRKNISPKPDPEDIEQLDLFEEEGAKNTDIFVDDYKDLDLEFVKSTRQKFLTWNDF